MSGAPVAVVATRALMALMRELLLLALMAGVVVD